MKILFAPEAAYELDDAVQWYNEEKKELGFRFAQVVDETILRITRYPKFNTEVRPGIYRAIVKRFPYCIYYSIEADAIMVYAIAHMHRMPYFWEHRFKKSK